MPPVIMRRDDKTARARAAGIAAGRLLEIPLGEHLPHGQRKRQRVDGEIADERLAVDQDDLLHVGYFARFRHIVGRRGRRRSQLCRDRLGQRGHHLAHRRLGAILLRHIVRDEEQRRREQQNADGKNQVAELFMHRRPSVAAECR